MGNIFATKERLISLNYKEQLEEFIDPTKTGKNINRKDFKRLFNLQ